MIFSPHRMRLDFAAMHHDEHVGTASRNHKRVTADTRDLVTTIAAIALTRCSVGHQAC
jgi:hypothetical protein